MAINNYFNNPESRFSQGVALLGAMNLDLNIDNPHADDFRLVIADLLKVGRAAKEWEDENRSDDKVSVSDHALMEAHAKEMERGIFTDEQRDAELERGLAERRQREENDGDS